MLNEAEARVHLNEMTDWVQARKRIGALKGLEAAQAYFKRSLRNADPDGAAADGPELAQGERPDFDVGALSDAERRRLFETLFPRMAGLMEAAWERAGEGPFSSPDHGWYHLRAPNDPGIVAKERRHWFSWVWHDLLRYNADAEWVAAWFGHLGFTGQSSAPTLLAAAVDAGGPTGDAVLEILKQSVAGTHEIGGMSDGLLPTLFRCKRPEAFDVIEGLLLAAKRDEGLRQAILLGAYDAPPEVFLRLLKLIQRENLVRFASTVNALNGWLRMQWDSIATAHASSIIDRMVTQLEHPAALDNALNGEDPETAFIAVWCAAMSDVDRAHAAAVRLLDAERPGMRCVGVRTLAQMQRQGWREHVVRRLSDPNVAVVYEAWAAVGCIEYRSHESDPTLNPVAHTVFDTLRALLERLQWKNAEFPAPVFPWDQTELDVREVARSMITWCPAERAEETAPLVDRLGPGGRIAIAKLLSRERTFNLDDVPQKLERRDLSPIARSVLIKLLGDASADVRENAAEILAARGELTTEEIARHEELLARAPGDIRSRAISRLLALPDAEALAAAARLLAAGKARLRAGIEILSAMAGAKRSVSEARRLAQGIDRKDRALTREDHDRLQQLATGASERITLDDALGLAAGYKPPTPPVLRQGPVDETTRAAVACLWLLNDLAEQHKHTPVVTKGADDDEDDGGADNDEVDDDDVSEYARLGGMSIYGGTRPRPDVPREEDLKRCPIPEIITGWLRNRPPSSRDADGRELIRAWILLRMRDERMHWNGGANPLTALAPKGRTGKLKHEQSLPLLVEWAMRFEGVFELPWMLDQFEYSVMHAVRTASPKKRVDSYRTILPELWLEAVERCPAAWRGSPDLATLERFSDIVRGVREVVRPLQPPADYRETEDFRCPESHKVWKEFHKSEIPTDDFVRLWEAGKVDDAEFYLRLAGPESLRDSSDGYVVYGSDTDLPLLMERAFRPERKHPFTLRRIDYPNPPAMRGILDRLRKRVLEIECARGDTDTPASHLVFDLRPSGGIDAVIPATAALGKLKLTRREFRTGKAANLSTIIRNSRPGAEDTAAAFAKAAKAAKLTDQRLVEIALFQPNWAAHIEHTLGWKGFEDGVLWLRAHTKEAESWSLEDDKEPWEGKVEERTRIPEVSRNAGAVDRAWFERCYKALGRSRWELLYDAAKYATSGTGHVRARLWADAMLGNVTEKELTERITKKRHQDAARALGLIEIKAGAAGKAQVLARYQVLQEMRRTSRKHGGSMLQASEKRAVEIGMENLAWTAGYPDPLRLQWAMEIEEFGDLAKGPVSVTVGDTTVTLAVDDEGVPSLSAFKTIAAKGAKKVAGKAAKGAAAKAGKGAAKTAKKGVAKGATAKSGAKGDIEPAAATVKPLKSVPPPLKKDKKVAPLVERLPLLRRQSSRIRLGLEQAMCRGDSFSGGELHTLWGHPILRTAIRNLVMIGATKSGGTLIGYPDKEGKVLRGVDGSFEPLKATDTLRIAHPLDLLATKKWHAWQKECFTAERMQPFKQVFREVYTPTATELKPTAKEKASRTSRYAGQQLQPRQALALFGSRGWVAKPEEGVQRIFHAESVTAHVEFEEGFYTPAEIDGLTLAGLAFVHTTKHEPIAIKDIPPRLFSEIMRDLDLVVSVAHRGQVDPEASHSTVEMRAALLRETAQLLGLTNITFDQSRAIIKGQRAEYALHLGSGTIHMLPGGALWIVPVHSQHRGRVFLPFADNDPKTAEVITKAIVLARDSEIKDPAILSQLRAAVG